MPSRKLLKKIKCPFCGLEYDNVDMAPHGMWALGTIREISFDCVKCEKSLLKVKVLLDVTPEGLLTFSRIVIANDWVDKYYREEDKDGDE